MPEINEIKPEAREIPNETPEFVNEMIWEATDILKAIDFEDTEKPLYHYTPADAMKNIIENKQFYLTDVNFVNDLFETKHVTSLLAELLENPELLKDEDFDLKKSIMEIADKSQTRAFILSFSKHDDELSMWNYYTGKTGYSLEIDLEQFKKRLGIKEDYTNIWDNIKPADEKEKSDKKIQNKNFKLKNSLKDNPFAPVILGRIIYDKEQQKELLKKIIEFNKKWATEESQPYCEAFMPVIFSRITPFVKSDHFKVEDEVRLAIIVDEDKFDISDFMNFRSSNNMIVPYLILDLSTHLQYLIKRVTIGPPGNNNPDIEKGIKQFLKAKGYYSTSIKKSKIGLRSINY